MKKAEWQSLLNDNERAELDRARLARDASAHVYRELVKKLKARCIKRLHRGREGGGAAGAQVRQNDN